jgi:hypothetical protein
MLVVVEEVVGLVVPMLAQVDLVEVVMDKKVQDK